MSADYQIIETQAELARALESLATAGRYAIDTEFHRERTYYPQLALIQIAWNDRLVLIDPLAVDVAPLGEILAGEGQAVIHAATQDLEVLELATGQVPTRLFDTQVTAGFVGMRTPSLASLHDHFLGLQLPKANRLTDWLRRPLEHDQIAYAASDVEHLLVIQDRLVDELVERGRLNWALDECEVVRTKGTATRDPADAWLRIKDARSLGARARSVAQAIASWRERTAQERDIPVRHVLPDLAVVALAQRPPKSADGFTRTRGMERRSLSRRDTAALLAVIEAAKDAPAPPAPQARRSGGGADLRPAVTLIAAWLGQYADDIRLDPAMLGSRADIEDFVRGGPSRLAKGWRHELAGEAISALLAGEAAVAFDGNGRVIVEQRSREPLTSGRFESN